ncbi:MAG: glycosyltransferase [Chromatiaceae bacterium]|jgi:glycosyltransferase involved in cell wall biosynthesis
MKVDYLFTTFPILSETFYQREIRALAGQGVDLSIYSLWGGGTVFEGAPINLFSKWRLLTLPFWIAYWLARRPKAVLGLLPRLFGSLPGSGLNLLENLLGLGFALTHAHQLSDRGRVLHAAWATAPGAAAQLIAALCNRPFTLGAHAYDVFRDGGDWWLEEKLRQAAMVVTSTEATATALRERGADPDKLQVIRRGLNVFPPMKAMRATRAPLRLLCVGRLIEKKGYEHQLTLYARCMEVGLNFEARIVGGGPLANILRAQLLELKLEDYVELLGVLGEEETAELYRWADVFIYTGVVADSGDQDGLPNVIPEAMCAGLPVVSTAVAGVPEAIENEVSGRLLPLEDIAQWIEALRRLATDDEYYARLRKEARRWVEMEFDASANAAKLVAAWDDVMRITPQKT